MHDSVPDVVATALSAKADASAMTTALSGKADASALASIISDWHPYNRTAGGSETGLIWSFAANGAVASVTTPDFEDGFEYMLVFDQVRSSSGTFGAIYVNLYRATSAAYAGVVSILGSTSASAPGSGAVEIPRARMTSKSHIAVVRMAVDNTDAAASVAGQNNVVVNHTTAQKLLRAQITHQTGNVSGSGATGAIYLYRRKLAA